MPSTDHFLPPRMSESDLADERRLQALEAEAEHKLRSRKSAVLNGLTYAIPLLTAAAIVFVGMGGGALWMGSLTQEALSSRLLSLSVVAAAAIGGYFFILREWLVSRQQLSAYSSAVIAEARESQDWVRQQRLRRGLGRAEVAVLGGSLDDATVSRD